MTALAISWGMRSAILILIRVLFLNEWNELFCHSQRNICCINYMILKHGELNTHLGFSLILDVQCYLIGVLNNVLIVGIDVRKSLFDFCEY